MEKQIKKLKFFIYVLGLVLVIQIVGSALFFRNSNFLYTSSLRNINSLIGEVGQLKDENRILGQKIDYQKQIISLNDQALTDIFEQIDTKLSSQEELKTGIEDFKTELETEKQQLVAENQKLSNLLDQKNTELEKTKNAQEITTEQDDLNDKIEAILFLGENQKLTDSIILITINPDKSKISLLSIPRDLYIHGRKINEYYEFYGIEKMEEIVKEVTGIKADKYVLFDFKTFTDFVDYLGGINVQIEKQLTDANYPTGGFGHKTVTFEPGIEAMNGERALEYARSRKSTSDFDRSLRQQKIILAIKNKLDSVDALEDVNFYLNAYKLVRENIETDLNVFEAIQTYQTYKNTQIFAGNILSNENFLYSSRSLTGQSILLPKEGDFLQFQQKILEII